MRKSGSGIGTESSCESAEKDADTDPDIYTDMGTGFPSDTALSRYTYWYAHGCGLHILKLLVNT